MKKLIALVVCAYFACADSEEEKIKPPASSKKSKSPQAKDGFFASTPAPKTQNATTQKHVPKSEEQEKDQLQQQEDQEQKDGDQLQEEQGDSYEERDRQLYNNGAENEVPPMYQELSEEDHRRWEESQQRFHQMREEQMAARHKDIEESLLRKRKLWFEDAIAKLKKVKGLSDEQEEQYKKGELKLPKEVEEELKETEKKWLDVRIQEEHDQDRKEFEKMQAEHESIMNGNADQEYEQYMMQHFPDEPSIHDQAHMEEVALHAEAENREILREKHMGPPGWKHEMLEQRKQWEDNLRKKEAEFDKMFEEYKQKARTGNMAQAAMFEKNLIDARANFERQMYGKEKLWEADMREKHKQHREWEINMIMEEREWEESMRQKSRVWEEKFIEQNGFNEDTKLILDQAREWETSAIQQARAWEEERIAQHRKEEQKKVLKKKEGWNTEAPQLTWDEEMKKKNEDWQAQMEAKKEEWDKKMTAHADDWFIEFAKKKPELLKKFGEEEGHKMWDEELAKERAIEDQKFKQLDAEFQTNLEMDILKKGLGWQQELAEQAKVSKEAKVEQVAALAQKFETMTKLERDWMRESFEENKKWEVFRVEKERKVLEETKLSYMTEKAKEREEKKFALDEYANLKKEREERKKNGQMTEEDKQEEQFPSDPPSELSDEENDLESLTMQMNLDKAKLDEERLKAQMEWDEKVLQKEREWKDYLLNLAKIGATQIPDEHVQDRLKTHDAWHNETKEFQKTWDERIEKWRQDYENVIMANERAAQEAFHQEELRRWHEENHGHAFYNSWDEDHQEL